MEAQTTRAQRVLVACDGGPSTGLGHVARSRAVAEEASQQGAEVVILLPDSTIGHPLVEGLTADIELHRGDQLDQVSLDRAVDRSRPSVVHVDSYGDLSLPQEVRRSNVQDGHFGRRPADLVVDSTLGAELGTAADRLGTCHALLGTDAVLLRDVVLDARRSPSRARPPGRRRVLVVMGGTDPHNATAAVLDALQDCEGPMEITVVAGAAGLRGAGAARPRRHPVEVLGAVADLPALAVQHDLVVSAAGTSVWELAYLGVRTALVCVADNQRNGYEAVVSAGLAEGLGGLPLDPTTTAQVVDRLLTDVESSGEGRRPARRLVDGLGRWRVVESWKRPTRRRADVEGRLLRPAAGEDAERLFSWRNDESVRAVSQYTEPLVWEQHLDWLTRTLADAGRHLFVVEAGGTPVATVRWDRTVTWDFEVSVAVDPVHRNEGHAAAALELAERWLADTVTEVTRVRAVIAETNEPSVRLFSRAGYAPLLPADARGFSVSARWVRPAMQERSG